MRGQSACANNAAMEADVLRKLAIDAYFTDVVIFLSNQDNKLKLISELFANHAVVMFESEGIWYLSDPTNFCFMEFTDFMQAKAFMYKLECKLKPNTMLIANDFEDGKFLSMMLSSFFNSDKTRLNTDVIYEIYNNVVEITKENMGLLEDFHECIKPDIDTVCRTLKRF